MHGFTGAGGLCCSMKGKTGSKCSCLLREGRWADPSLPLIGGLGLRGGFAVCPPLGGAVFRNHSQYPAFVPSTSEVAAAFGPFCILLFIICLNCACVHLSLVLYLYSVAWGDVYLSSSAAVKSPRSQSLPSLSLSDTEESISRVSRRSAMRFC